MRGSGKTKYKKIGKQLGIPWTAVRDRELAGLTHLEKKDQDPLNTAGWRDKKWGRS